MTEKEIREHLEKHLEVLESTIEYAENEGLYGDVVELSKQIIDTICWLGVSCNIFPISFLND